MPRPLTDLIHWVGLSRILASAFGVLVVVVGVCWVVRVPPPPPEAMIPFATSTIAQNSLTTRPVESSSDGLLTGALSAASITVYV